MERALIELSAGMREVRDAAGVPPVPVVVVPKLSGAQWSHRRQRIEVGDNIGKDYPSCGALRGVGAHEAAHSLDWAASRRGKAVFGACFVALLSGVVLLAFGCAHTSIGRDSSAPEIVLAAGAYVLLQLTALQVRWVERRADLLAAHLGDADDVLELLHCITMPIGRYVILLVAGLMTHPHPWQRIQAVRLSPAGMRQPR